MSIPSREREHGGRWMTAALGAALLAAGSCAGGGGKPVARPGPATSGAVVATPAAPPAADKVQIEATAPDTPAGKTLAAWLEAFNSADEARVQAYVERYKHPNPARGMLELREMTGGFTLIAIQKSAPREVRFVVREQGSPATAMGWLTVKDGDPAEVASFRVEVIPPGVTAAQMDGTVDAATRTRVIDGVAARLTALYVYADVAEKMVAALRAHQRAGAYDAVTDSRAFALLLTEHLRDVSHDRHLGVDFRPMVVPEVEAEPTDAEQAEMRAWLERIHCGFHETERLDGNVGYLRFDMFADVETCGPTATAAMASLAGADALIIDLRDNGGGHPDMVAFVSSWLFAKRTHLNDLYDRGEDKTTPYWTRPEVAAVKLAKQPVFVLTSARTFSGAEEFSYNLRQLERATLVGETTGGGAHPTAGKRVDDHFIVRVPFARAVNPISKTNWEGTGVEPHVKVPADQALETAKRLAAEQLAKAKKKRGR